MLRIIFALSILPWFSSPLGVSLSRSVLLLDHSRINLWIEDSGSEMLWTKTAPSLHLLFLIFCRSGHLCASFTFNSSQYSVSNNTSISDVINPHCFTHDSYPGAGLTNSADCREALRVLARDPLYGERRARRFSKNERNGIKVPRGWQHGFCMIIVSCVNDHDADYLRLLDVSMIAVSIIKRCVDEPEMKYGGLHGVGDAGTFYVSVGRSADPHVSSISSGNALGMPDLTNDTLLEMGSGETSSGTITVS